jgi:hypothetical protein
MIVKIKQLKKQHIQNLLNQLILGMTLHLRKIILMIMMMIIQMKMIIIKKRMTFYIGLYTKQAKIEKT